MKKLIPQRDEEVLQRRITALHLAGDFAGADQNCQRFQQTFPKSPLLPVVLFRFAENAYFQAQAAEKIPDANQRKQEVTKLQDEAFQTAGMKTKAPSTKMSDVRRSGLPPAQASVMDLKTGEISAVISDASGYYIFKVGTKEEEPLDKVKEEIRGSLRSQHMQEQMQAVQQSATPSLDESYFGPEMPATHGMPMPPPTGGPASKPPASGPQ